jgi:hypothetical protein
MRGLRIALLAAVAVLVVGVPGAPAATKSVKVTLRDATVGLSAKTAPIGTVKFLVKNAGTKSHDFRINLKKTALLKPGKSATLTVVFRKAAKFTYMVTTPGKTVRLHGVFTVTKPVAPPPSGNVAAGKVVFTSNGCGSCHTLAAAGTTGTVGKNLDVTKPTVAAVIDCVTNGKPGMPSFKGALTDTQIKDVAAFVYASTH